ncbi:MAG: diaminopimelate epimerase [Bdellovibrionales bacterium]|nr:diaminopimelate epimerase [Bdellovibrionales bacterium]
MNKLKFTKMHGLGNDYIYINCLEQTLTEVSELAKKLSKQHFGIGSDGLVLIEASKTADYKMKMFNADGSEAEMCGNAVRCVAKFLYDRGFTSKEVFSLETLGGKKKLKLNIANNKVSSVQVEMGKPVFLASEIPVELPEKEIINHPFEILDQKLLLNCVSMGNPHAVFFVDEITDYQVHVLGPLIEKHLIFPDRTNVHFAKVINREEIFMRVWERGSGETLACGTGACAVLAAAVKTDKANKNATIKLPGGDLHIEWREDQILMTGPAEFVFDGEIDYP